MYCIITQIKGGLRVVLQKIFPIHAWKGWCLQSVIYLTIELALFQENGFNVHFICSRQIKNDIE